MRIQTKQTPAPNAHDWARTIPNRSTGAALSSVSRALPLVGDKHRGSKIRAQSNSDPDLIRDEILIQRVKIGDSEALEVLFHRYYLRVFSVALRIVRSREEAQDVVQDVFFYLFRRAVLFEEHKGSAASWIIQIAYHRSLDRRRWLRFRLFSGAQHMDTVTEAAMSLELAIWNQQLCEKVRSALQTLSERQRFAIEKHCLEGLDLREIAALSNDSLSNVRHHYYRGLQRLRVLLQDDLSFFRQKNGT
ncbi:MAG: RNA polymerase sigma factor [Bryobacteraceae bacterium]